MAADRDGKRFPDWKVGASNTETGRKLWGAIKNDGITDVMSDYWQPYEKCVPPGLHTQSKTETHTVEGYNSLFGHYKQYSDIIDIVKIKISM